jgi:hypothetical protein
MALSPAALAYYQQVVIPALTNAKHGEKRRIVARAAQHFGISIPTVYRELEEAGHDTTRKTRSDRGSSKVTDQEAKFVANLMIQTTRDNGKRLLTVKTAKEIAMANGILKTDVSEARLSAVMRDVGCHPEQLNRPFPHTHILTPHPNFLWQIDASTCVMFYMPNGQVSIMDERKYNQKKPAQLAKLTKERVTRYLAVDHHSAAFYLEYVLGAESSEHFISFLLNAMQQREKLPFHGVPFNLYFDAASGHQAHTSKSLLDWLQIDYRHHLPNNARATGSVEVHQNIVEREFEAILSFYKPKSLEELNENAWKWMHAFQAKRVVSRHGHTRYGSWSTIRNEQLRRCPDQALCREIIHTTVKTRNVNPDLTVKFKGTFWDVSEIKDIRIGDPVEVVTNPYNDQVVRIKMEDRQGNVTFHECPSAEGKGTMYGNYASASDTKADQTRKEMLKEAYGTESILEADQRKHSKKEVAFAGQIDPMLHIKQVTIPTYLNRRGVDLPVTKPTFEVPNFTVVEALIKLRTALNRRITSDESAWISKRFPDGVPQDQMESLVDQFTNPSQIKEVKRA